MSTTVSGSHTALIVPADTSRVSAVSASSLHLATMAPLRASDKEEMPNKEETGKNLDSHRPTNFNIDSEEEIVNDEKTHVNFNDDTVNDHNIVPPSHTSTPGNVDEDGYVYPGRKKRGNRAGNQVLKDKPLAGSGVMQKQI